MLLGEIVDELLNQNGLADAGAAEQTRLAATDVGLEQVDGLNAGLEDLGLGGELVEMRCRVMDGIVLIDLGHGLAVDRLAHNIPNAAEGLGADGHLHRCAGVDRDDAALQAVGRRHGDGTNNTAGKLRLNLQDGADVTHRRIGLDRERVVDRGDSAIELNVDDGADDTDDTSLTGRLTRRGLLDRRFNGGICH